MKYWPISLAAVVAGFLTFGFTGEARAHFFNPALETPSLIEPVQCRTVTVRERVGNRTVVRKKTTCARRPAVVVRPPVVRSGCKTVRTRIVGRGGKVTFKTVRRC